MNAQVPALIVAVPLLAALVVTGAWWFNRKLCLPIALAAGFVALAGSVSLFREVLAAGAVEYRLGGWRVGQFFSDKGFGKSVSAVSPGNIIKGCRPWDGRFQVVAFSIFPRLLTGLRIGMKTIEAV